MPNARFLTNFADQAVLLPLAICVGLTFAIAGWRRGAIAWTVAVGGTFLITLSLKLIFLACGHLLPFPDVRSPSGHTAASAVVYGSLLALGIRRVTGHARWTVPSAVLVTLVIGASRLALGLHTGQEVLLGGIIGVGGAIVAGVGAGPPPARLPVRVLTAVALGIVVFFHGFHLPAEAAIRSVALNLWPLSSCR